MVPVVSVFFGIIIRMYFGDHAPPHFHAEYQGETATFTFSGELMAGYIGSATARKLIKQWARVRHAELVANWQRVEALDPLLHIPPLE
jgi:hypothetical protein